MSRIIRTLQNQTRESKAWKRNISSEFTPLFHQASGPENGIGAGSENLRDSGFHADQVLLTAAVLIGEMIADKILRFPHGIEIFDINFHLNVPPFKFYLKIPSEISARMFSKTAS